MSDIRKTAATWAIFVFLLVSVAHAGSHRYSATHITKKSPAQIWQILTAYSETCQKGCKYYRPDLVEVRKLTQRAEPSSWYTWTHVTNPVRDVKYFTHVTVQFKDNGDFVTNSRQLDDSRKDVIKALEDATGLKHSPGFDEGNTHTVALREGDGTTKVTQVVTLTSSGIVAMWPAKVMEGIRQGIAATFKNIGP